MAAAPETGPYWPLWVYFAGVIVTVAGMLGLSYVTGQRHSERATGAPYESGIVVTGSARVRLPVRFYLIAIFFVVFDLEALFIFAWACAVRELGWAGYAAVCVFIGTLLALFVYLWRLKALEP